MIYHYSIDVLERLIKFKNSEKDDPGKELLAVLLDGSREYNIGVLEKVLFDGKSTKLRRKERVRLLEQVISELFHWNYHSLNRHPLCHSEPSKKCMGIWMLEMKEKKDMDALLLNTISKRKKAIIRRGVRNHNKECKHKPCCAELGVSEGLGGSMMYNKSSEDLQVEEKMMLNGQKRQKAVFIDKKKHEKANKSSNKSSVQVEKTTSRNPSLLSFARPEPKQEKAELEERGSRFQPLVSLRMAKKSGTVRRRDDIVSPKKVTYIKFFDRIKPAIYKIVYDKFFVKDSTKKLPCVVDYDYDSELEWEDFEDAEDINTTTGSSEGEEEDDNDLDFIDTESDTTVDKNFKAPSIKFPVLDVQIFCDYKNDLEAPLFRHETFPDHLVPTLESEVKDGGSVKVLSASFGDRYHIRAHVVQKKIKEIKTNMDDDKNLS